MLVVLALNTAFVDCVLSRNIPFCINRDFNLSLSLSLTHQGTLIKGGEEKMLKIEALEIFCYIIRERAL